MKIMKRIKALLMVSTMICSTTINSLASSLFNTNETFSGNNLILEDIYHERNSNVSLEGRTLVNHIDSLAGIQGNVWTHENGTFTYDPASVSDTLVGGGLVWDVNAIESNTTYSLIYNCTNNSYTRGVVLNPDEGHYIPGYIDDIDELVYNTTEGVNILVFKTKEKLSATENSIKLTARPNGDGVFSIKEDIMLLKGDWRDKEIPRYFTGIKSGFEEHLVESSDDKNAGKFKVDIKSTGKNLFNPSLLEPFIIDRDGDFVRLDYFNMYHGTKFKMPVKGSIGKRYTLTYTYKDLNISNAHFGFKYTDGTFEYVVRTNNFNEVTTVSASSNPNKVLEAITITYGYSLKDFWVDINSIQLEEGDTATNYSEYKESLRTIYLNHPLYRGDELKYEDNKVIHVRASNSVVLDGSSDEIINVNPYNESSLISSFSVNLENSNERNSNNNVYSDLFATTIHWGDEEGLAFASSNSFCYINILTSKLSSDDIKGIREWLSQNPITIVYELNKKVYEEVDSEIDISLFEGKTYVNNSSTVPVSMQIDLNRQTDEAVKYSLYAELNPTYNTLTLARSLVNQIEEGELKERLQEKLNQIISLNDLTFDRKTVSANLDIYIKSENMLSMSLDTNSITFDGYSGAAPMELEDAVNITINSSLPYDLNVYMPTEISNSDGSNKINLDIFNIKESSESNYQQFVDNTNKIVLKSNCDEGNGNNHKIDLKLDSNSAYQADVYKAVIRFEAIQK